MNKKIVVMLGLALIVVVSLVLFLNRPKKPLSTPLSDQAKEITPSETLIEYTDPTGFSFSYPDNLSLTKNEETDDSTYADIQLSSKDVNGSLNLKISDSKFASIDDWLKLKKDAYKEAPKEVELGNLKAFEVKTADRLLLGAFDQGVFFTIEMPLVEEDFWMKVYDKILANFSFVSPQEGTTLQGQESDVIFEGEEVVE